MAKTEIVDVQAEQSQDAVPSELRLGKPFAVVDDCDLEDRGGTLCKSCKQPACSGAVAILKCDCGQRFRVDLLESDDVHECPGANCGRTYTTMLLVASPDNEEIFAHALATVLRANGYEVAHPDDEDEDDGELGNAGDDQADDEDEDREAVEDDEADDVEPV